jgi:hypothetical protein
VDKYIIVNLEQAKLLAKIIKEEIIEDDGAYSYVFCDAKYRLREVSGLLNRIEQETGADLNDIAGQLKNMRICPACSGEGQEHSCSSLVARTLGRRLKRVLKRADGDTSELANDAEK